MAIEIVDLPIEQVIFHSYVSLPEGIYIYIDMLIYVVPHIFCAQNWSPFSRCPVWATQNTPIPSYWLVDRYPYEINDSYPQLLPSGKLT